MRGHSTRTASRVAGRIAGCAAGRIAALGIATAAVSVTAALIPFAAAPAAGSEATGAWSAPPPPEGWQTAAVGADAPAAVPAGARLDIVLHEGDAKGSVAAEVALACLPTGGNHPYRDEACRSLEQVDGRIESLPSTYDGTCQMIVDPVTITVDGYWRRKAINYQKTFPNRCFAERVASNVFRFF